jgi:cysteine desulfuration protein SufE
MSKPAFVLPPDVMLEDSESLAMIDISEKQAKITKEFQEITDWKERYRKIIDRGIHLKPLPEQFRTSKFLVKGCQNQVWLHAECHNGRVHFFADSEAQIVKGLVTLLLEVYSGHAPDDILSTPPIFIAQLNLGENLSMNRANGLSAIVSQIKRYALAFKLLSERTVKSQEEKTRVTESLTAGSETQLTEEMLERIARVTKE